MSLEVYINDSIIDLKESGGLGVTFQVGGVLNPNARSGFLTNKFSVPKTKNNNEVLGVLLNINSTSNIPYVRNTAKIVQNGLEIVIDGFALIDSTGGLYGVTIYAGNTSFFDLIAGSNVNELDWTNSDHNFNRPNVSGMLSNTENFIYALIDFGISPLFTLYPQNDVRYENLIPSAFVKDVLNKSANENGGYKITGDFIENEFYERLILTPNRWGFTQEEADLAAGDMGVSTVSSGVLNVPIGTGTTELILPLNFNDFSSPAFAGVSWTAPNDIIATLYFSCNVTFDRPDSTKQIRINPRIYKNGVLVAQEIIDFSTPPFPSGALSFTGGPTVTYTPPLITAGDVFTCEIALIGFEQPGGAYNTNWTLEFQNFFTVSPNPSFIFDLFTGTNIPFATLFDVPQIDVWKSIINMYGLTVQTNTITKEINLTSLNKILENISIAKDWSEILDLSKTPSVKYKLGRYAQRSNFKYKEDDNVFAGQGDGFVNVQNENIEPEIDIIQLNVAAAESVLRINNNKTVRIPARGSSQIENFSGINSRILLLDRIMQVTNFYFYSAANGFYVNGDTQTEVPLAYFDNADKSDNLGFPSLINEHYQALVGMLDQTKFVTAYFNLKEIDVIDLDFAIPIYLDVHSSEVHINGYFYINKISNFKENAQTKVDLIRL